jgi:hypothetical protein
VNDSADGPILEIHDADIDATALRRRVAEAVEQRRVAGAYGPDPATLGPEALRPTNLLGKEPAHAYADNQALHQMLAEMTDRAHLQELTFTSQIPVLGRLVAAARNAWSWMAARWLGQHLMRQQTAFNCTAVQFGRELVHRQEAELRLVRQLEDRVRDLEARLAKLEDVSRARENGG